MRVIRGQVWGTQFRDNKAVNLSQANSNLIFTLSIAYPGPLPCTSAFGTACGLLDAEEAIVCEFGLELETEFGLDVGLALSCLASFLANFSFSSFALASLLSEMQKNKKMSPPSP